MRKWVKFAVALLLLPICAATAIALRKAARAGAGADTTWVPMLAGAGCWLGIYLLLPKPMLVYVFGHELTHALWTWVMGGRVKKFKASAKGGHVIVTKVNFLITLAPYFFPLYALLLIALYWGLRFVWDLREYAVWYHLLLGAAYAFHITLTWHVLKMTQTDITDQGYLFSGVIIFLGNAGVLLVAIPLLTAQLTLSTVLGWWWSSFKDILGILGKALGISP